MDAEGSGVTEVALAWYDGFWNLLHFAMQMVIIPVTGLVAKMFGYGITMMILLGPFLAVASHLLPY